MPRPRKRLSYTPTEVSKFCIFWIPCVFHTDLNVISGKEVQKEKFTTRQNFKFKVRSEVIVNKQAQTWDGKIIINLNIVDLNETEPEFKKNINVKLISKDFRRNGLIKFEYSLIPEQHQLFDDMRDQAYSLIKNHFHVHEFHSYFTSVKSGYYEDVNLCTPDNEALICYINQFYTLLKEQLDQIEDDYKWLELNKTNYSPELNKARYLFYESCENVFGQLVYYNSILNSKWNESCRLIPTTAVPNEDLRRLAHNYYNLISKLQSIYQRSRSIFYLSNIHENVETQQRIKEIAGENNIIINKVDDAIKKVDDALKESSKTNNISLSLAILSVLLGAWSIYLALRDNTSSQIPAKESSEVVLLRSNKILTDSITIDSVVKKNRLQ